jgi:hypothetical protein
MITMTIASLTLFSFFSYLSYIAYLFMNPEEPPVQKEFIFPPYKPRVPENSDCFHIEIQTGNWEAELDTEWIINLFSSF